MSIHNPKPPTQLSDTAAFDELSKTIRYMQANQSSISGNRYQILSRIAEGTSGVVLCALDTVLERKVAIKIPRHTGVTAAAASEFLHEARVAARIRHPGVVAVFDFGQDHDGTVFVVEQFVSGTSLAELAVSKPIENRQAIQIMADVAEAIQAAHDQELIHRDLKPSNILIDHQGQAYVTDFGLAILLGRRQQAVGEISGSPAYMSPEQCRGETDKLDGRSDVWSIGIVLHELLTGQLPFQGGNLDEVFDQICHSDSVILRASRNDLPGNVIEICEKCLRKRPEDRFQSAGDLSFALRNILKEMDGDTHHESATLNTSASIASSINLQTPRRQVAFAALAALIVGVTFAEGVMRQAGSSDTTSIPTSKVRSVSYKKPSTEASELISHVPEHQQHKSFHQNPVPQVKSAAMPSELPAFDRMAFRLNRPSRNTPALSIPLTLPPESSYRQTKEQNTEVSTDRLLLTFDGSTAVPTESFVLSIQRVGLTEESGLALMVVDEFESTDVNEKRDFVTLETFTVEYRGDDEVSPVFWHCRLEMDAVGEVIDRRTIARIPLAAIHDHEINLRVTSSEEPKIGLTTHVQLLPTTPERKHVSTFSSQLRGYLAIGVLVRQGMILASLEVGKLNSPDSNVETPPPVSRQPDEASPGESEPNVKPQPTSRRSRLAVLPE